MKQVDLKHTMKMMILNNNFLISLQDKYKENPSMTIKEFFDLWNKENSSILDRFNLYHQGTLLSCLYGIVVMTKENFCNHLPDETAENDAFKFKPILLENSDKKLQVFVGRIRNSLSHGRFEISDDLRFIFRDRHKRSTEDEFIVEFDQMELIKFLNYVVEKIQEIEEI